MNKNDLIQRFIDGKVFVYIDKENMKEQDSEDVDCLAQILKEHYITKAAYSDMSIEAYLKDSAAGPYHFVKPKLSMITGGAYAYCHNKGNEYEIVTLHELVTGIAVPDIPMDDFINFFNTEEA